MKNNNICSHCKTNMREKWLKFHLEQGLPITKVARLSGFHQDTLYIWKRNYLEKGTEGLLDESRAPHNHPNEYSEDIKDKIKFLRKEGKGSRYYQDSAGEKIRHYCFTLRHCRFSE